MRTLLCNKSVTSPIVNMAFQKIRNFASAKGAIGHFKYLHSSANFVHQEVYVQFSAKSTFTQNFVQTKFRFRNFAKCEISFQLEVREILLVFFIMRPLGC